MTDTELEAMRRPAPDRKPRLVLMGEFSAGKSTLSNILLGGAPLPMQVTATRLPPVHISLGEPSAYAIDFEGISHPFDPADLDQISPEEVKSIHLTMMSDTLELFDLVDMPGISDPNMAADTWDDVVGMADHVVWCTHATQAWRQSEAALWDRIRDSTRGKNLLLINQFDKLRTPRDRERVLARVRAEVAGKFEGVYPISLLDALNADDDFEAWKASGAEAFMEDLIGIVLGQDDSEALPPAAPAPEQAAPPPAAAASVAEAPAASAEPPVEADGNDSSVVRLNFPITPRRVQARADHRERPARLPHDAVDVGARP